jgi:tRNA A-37 threonylcarbamoyl transferase component Bud32
MMETRSCPQCGGNLHGDAPHGLCPQCLLQSGLSSAGDTPVKGDAAAISPYQGPFIAPEPAKLASKFPQLEVLELLGQGGMGAVYKARQPKLDRLVALKILPPEVGRDPTFAERFSREARALAKLSHPNIVGVHDFGEVDGFYYFVMDYVDGGNLRQILWSGQLAPGDALKIVPQICEALQYAHDEGVVHRDIKPENILLDRKGRVKIADFGLARLLGRTPAQFTLTGSQQVMGTPYYMAPEQMYKPLSVDHRADIYSLGVVIYEMLTSELPLGRFAPPSQKVRVDDRLDPIVLRALAKEPEHRYQQVSELKSAVEGITQKNPGLAPLPTVMPAQGPPGSPAARPPQWAPEARRSRLPDLDMIRMDVKAPAAGLMVTGLLALISWVLLLSLVPINTGHTEFVFNYGSGHWLSTTEPMGRAFPVLIPVTVLPAILLLLGAFCMRNCAGYEFAVMASVLAILPWYPAWVIGVFMGLWALLVLRRREVKAAFAATANPGSVGLNLSPESSPPLPQVGKPRGPFGKVKSLFRSVCSYFVSGAPASPPAPVGRPEPAEDDVHGHAADRL